MLTIGQLARLSQISPRMLRHYDRLGLLRPEHVDAKTGYRSYAVSQLSRLQRLIALRDLGFGLESIAALLDEPVSIERMRGMLQLRRAQIEKSVDEELDRLRRVEACLRSLETSPLAAEIVVKTTQPLRIAEAQGMAKGFGHENLAPVFMEVIPRVLSHLQKEHVKPGLMIAHYDEPTDDGSVVLHAGFAIGSQTVTDGNGIEAVDLPAVEVASCVHRGSMEGVGAAYESLMRYIEDSGYTMSGFGREIYLEVEGPTSPKNVTELQLPIVRARRNETSNRAT